MKRSNRVALGGMTAALALVCMLLAWFPYFTYALPAMAGCMLIPLVIEAGCNFALAVYGVVGILSFFLCEKEAAMLFIFFFGFYPVLKVLLEKIRLRPLEWLAKFAVFNLCIVCAYLIILFVMKLDVDMMGELGKYASLILLAMGNAVFWIYDIAVTRLASMYQLRLHKTIKKMIG